MFEESMEPPSRINVLLLNNRAALLSSYSQIRCKECDYTSERLEPYLDLTVAISGYSDLSESLTDCYLNHETLSGNNQYRCDGCNKLVDAEKVSY